MARDPLASPERLIRRVYAYAAYRLGDGPDAEDATQQTFERALRYRATYDPRKGAPIAWLLGIARRCCDDVRQSAIPLGEPDVDLPDHGDLEPRTIRRLGLQRAVVALDEHSRDLIALRYGAELTARQIGELLGQRTNAVEVALHRALERLRSQVGEDL